LARLRPAEEPGGATIQAGLPKRETKVAGPCLVVVKGLDEGESYPLPPPFKKGEWLIGRRRGLHVTIDYDPYVSTENTAIEWDAGTYYVRDLPDSRNGTTLNFQPIEKNERAPLRSGDVIGVGRSLLVFKD
jgi:pSer/pThr/pTyr-binding forkhead associated (FHA) protein